MPLASRLGNNIQQIQFEHMTVPISCHLASAIWLFREVYGKEPSTSDLKALVSANLNDVLKKIALAGSIRVAPASRGSSISISPGSVVVFMYNGEPKHSCIAKSIDVIGGFNQVGWFSQGGTSHGYSEHPLTQLRWGRGGTANDVEGSGQAAWCRLHSTIEDVAKREFKGAMGG